MSNNVNNNGETQNQKKPKSQLIRNLFISAALSTAIVSIFTTAQGLDMYFFRGNWLFAGIISVAIQGVLFALNISAIPLLKSNKIRGWLGRVMVVVVWFAFLIASSTFSYVYVSKYAYSDTVMHEDAERSLILFTQQKHYDILEKARQSKDYYEKTFISYITTLNGEKLDGFKVSQDVVDLLDKDTSNLTKWKDKYNETSDSFVFDATGLSSYIDKFKSGKFTDTTITSFYAEIDNYVETINNRIKLYGTKDGEGVYARALQDKDQFDERLKTWTSGTENPKYNIFMADRENAGKRVEEIESILGDLDAFKSILSDCRVHIENNLMKGTESVIYDESNNILNIINTDLVDIDKLNQPVGKIYAELLKENIPSNDPRITGYTDFMKGIDVYKDLVNCERIADAELKMLNSRSNNSVIDYTNSEDIESPEHDSDQTNPLAPTDGDIVDTQKLPVQNDSYDKEWHDFWNQRLETLLSEVALFPSVVVIKENNGDDTEINDSNNEYLVINAYYRNELLREVSERKRLYLTELNDFDRAFSLLKEYLFGFHEHGLMVTVSLVFAFGIDLFSLAAGVLLYFFRSTHRTAVKTNP